MVYFFNMCILIHILYSIHVMKKKWLQANPTAIGQVESGRDRAKDVARAKLPKAQWREQTDQTCMEIVTTRLMTEALRSRTRTLLLM